MMDTCSLTKPIAVLCTALIILTGAHTALAQTGLSTALSTMPSTQKQFGQWVHTAQQQDPHFQLSAARGQAFYRQSFTHNPDMPSCTSCHTADPKMPGKHAVTGKAIAPFSPLANAERFTDVGKMDKWFKRNCNDVIGRECSAAEKANLLAYLFFGAKVENKVEK